MGGFATGFLGQIGDTVKKKADEAHDASVAQKKSQSDIYWGVIKNPDSTPEQINYAHDQLGKLYPKDPQIKQLFDKFRGLIQQTHPGHQQGGAQQDGGQAGGSIPAPPQPPSAGAAPAGAAAPTATGTIATPAFNPNAKSAIPPPPKPQAAATPAAAPRGTDPRFAEMSKAAGSTAGAEAKANAEYDRREKQKHEYKMAELDEAAQAKATNPTGRATAISPISMSEARKMAAAGQTFTAADGGDPLTLDDYDDTMMLVPLQQNGKIVGYSPASQKQTHLTYNNKVIAVPSLNQMDANVKGTELGAAQVGATTRTTDPATGQTTVAVKTPNAPAAAGDAATSAPPKASPAPSAAPPAKSPPIAKSASGTGTVGAPTSPSSPSASAPTQPAPRGLPPPDADGHIPAVAGTPQVVEGANQLLNSEKDVKDLPAKTRELSASMARKYGWDENAFNPQERRQIGVAAHFVDKLLANPNLDTLDSDFWSQLPMLGATSDVAKEGFFGKIGTKLASRALTDEQADFLRDYRQAVSVISGLGKLSRGGRVTEATVNRLLTDLPNPANTKNSKDARERLKLLQDEVQVALTNGAFEEASGKSKRKSAIAAPPKPSDASAGQLSQAAKEYLKSQGVPVP